MTRSKLHIAFGNGNGTDMEYEDAVDHLAPPAAPATAAALHHDDDDAASGDDAFDNSHENDQDIDA